MVAAPPETDDGIVLKHTTADSLCFPFLRAPADDEHLRIVLNLGATPEIARNFVRARANMRDDVCIPGPAKISNELFEKHWLANGRWYGRLMRSISANLRITYDEAVNLYLDAVEPYWSRPPAQREEEEPKVEGSEIES